MAFSYIASRPLKVIDFVRGFFDHDRALLYVMP